MNFYIWYVLPDGTVHGMIAGAGLVETCVKDALDAGAVSVTILREGKTTPINMEPEPLAKKVFTGKLTRGRTQRKKTWFKAVLKFIGLPEGFRWRRDPIPEEWKIRIAHWEAEKKRRELQEKERYERALKKSRAYDAENLTPEIKEWLNANGSKAIPESFPSRPQPAPAPSYAPPVAP